MHLKYAVISEIPFVLLTFLETQKLMFLEKNVRSFIGGRNVKQ